jgi:hypothetical protein
VEAHGLSSRPPLFVLPTTSTNLGIPLDKDVKEEKYIWPTSPWPLDPRMREVGLYNMSNMLDGFRGAGWKMLQAAGLSPPDIEQLTEDVKREVQDTRNRFYFTIYIIYGRKPFDFETSIQIHPR